MFLFGKEHRIYCFALHTFSAKSEFHFISVSFHLNIQYPWPCVTFFNCKTWHYATIQTESTKNRRKNANFDFFTLAFRNRIGIVPQLLILNYKITINKQTVETTVFFLRKNTFFTSLFRKLNYPFSCIHIAHSKVFLRITWKFFAGILLLISFCWRSRKKNIFYTKSKLTKVYLSVKTHFIFHI